MWRGLGVAAFAIPCWLSVGCGGGGGGSKTIAAEDFEAAAVDALCASAADCGIVADEASCRETADTGSLADLLAAVEAGTIVYHGDLAGTCLDEIEQIYEGCSQMHGMQVESQADDACNSVFEGTVAGGGDCFVDAECESIYCEVPEECADACCMGTCAAPVADIPVGGDCSDGFCVAGTYCTMDTSICTAQVGEGEACESFDACEPGFACVGVTFGGAPGTCTALADEGDACDPETFLFCDRLDDFCDPASGTCEKRHAVGDPCDPEVEDACVGFAYCDAGTCRATPGIGDACDLENGPDCDGDLECVDGTCVQPETEICPR